MTRYTVPAAGERSLRAGALFTWRGTHLGHGTYTRDANTSRLTASWGPLTLTSRDGVLYLALDARVINDPTPAQALGHVNQFQPTWTVMEGTGRFVGITGTLSGTFKTKSLRSTPILGSSTGRSEARRAASSPSRLGVPHRGQGRHRSTPDPGPARTA